MIRNSTSVSLEAEAEVITEDIMHFRCRTDCKAHLKEMNIFVAFMSHFIATINYTSMQFSAPDIFVWFERKTAHVSLSPGESDEINLSRRKKVAIIAIKSDVFTTNQRWKRMTI